jgi:hypothetical protein
MRRLARPVAALAVLVLLARGVMGAGGARAASPPPTPPPPPAPTATPTYHPTLQLSATGGAAGAALIAVADGFPPTGQVTVYWDGAYLTRGTTDDSGYVALRTAVPHDAADGPHEVRAVGPRHTTAGAAFTVATPPAPVYHPHVTLSLAHAQATRGTVLTADLSGFAPNQDVTLAWDRVGGTVIAAHAADANGDTSFDIVLGIDPTPGVGTHRLYASGSHPTLSTSASFTVDPPPPPPPACGGVGFTVPFINWAVCLDPFGTLGSWLAHGATAGADAIGRQVATDLTTQQDYTRIAELQPVFGTMQQLARDLFGLLFVAGATAWYARRLGLGPGGEAATQMVEGGLGLALTLSLPNLMHLYIVAVNAASGQILADPNNQGGATIGLLVTRLISGDLVSVITVNPVFMGVIAGFVVVFFALLVLIAITRTIGTMYGAAVYMATPVCAICMVTPLTRSVAAAWARLWFSLTLWGVSYAVALVAVRAMLAVFAHTGGLQSLAAALAGGLVLYGAPRLGDALLGGGASRALGIGNVPMLGTAARMGLAAATGGAAGTVVASGGEGTTGGVPPRPAMPSVTEMPNASVSEIASIAPPINAEWGLIE